ncbi:hypothetical protein [Bradyrhizobium sp.]|uniref:hypothetical protein n=2 Tax=Bradyrhizobium sp. TaxID=376 RepID=UPI00345CB505
MIELLVFVSSLPRWIVSQGEKQRSGRHDLLHSLFNCGVDIPTALPARLFLGILSTRAQPSLALIAHLTAKRREMKSRTSVSELSATLGYPSSETVQGLRLWKAFIKLSPAQRSEVLAWVEQLATDPAPLPGGMNGRFGPR